MRRWTFSTVSAGLVLALVTPHVAWAQTDEEASGELVAYAYNLQHRGAAEALELVLPLLSSRGAVELQPGGNALVVRDTAEVLQLIRPRLRAYDHPFEPLRIRVQIIRAERSGESSGPQPELPAGLLTRLHELLKYESYSLLAGSELVIEDGMMVMHDVGDQYRVDFRLRHVLSDTRASLEGFRLSRGTRDDSEPLIHANLNLDLEKPMVLGLAPSESSDSALMLVIESVPMPVAVVLDE